MKRKLSIQPQLTNVMTLEERMLQQKYGGHFCQWARNQEMNGNKNGFGDKCKNGKKCKGLLSKRTCDLWFCCPCYRNYCEKRPGNWSGDHSGCVNEVCDRLEERNEILIDRACILDQKTIDEILPGFTFDAGVKYQHIDNEKKKREGEGGSGEFTDSKTDDEDEEEESESSDIEEEEEETPPNPNTPQQEKVDDNTEITIYKIIRGTIDENGVKMVQVLLDSSDGEKEENYHPYPVKELLLIPKFAKMIKEFERSNSYEKENSSKNGRLRRKTKTEALTKLEQQLPKKKKKETEIEEEKDKPQNPKPTGIRYHKVDQPISNKKNPRTTIQVESDNEQPEEITPPSPDLRDPPGSPPPSPLWSMESKTNDSDLEQSSSETKHPYESNFPPIPPPLPLKSFHTYSRKPSIFDRQSTPVIVAAPPPPRFCGLRLFKGKNPGIRLQIPLTLLELKQKAIDKFGSSIVSLREFETKMEFESVDAIVTDTIVLALDAEDEKNFQ